MNLFEALTLESNKTFTENGAVTNASSLSDTLDLFATIGAMRNRSDEDIIEKFENAYTEDPDISTKIIFFARDIRGGLGERKVFRTILRHMAKNHTDTVLKNIAYIPEYGRWDDLLVLMDTPCEQKVVSMIRERLSNDVNALAHERYSQISLLAKWLPSVNTSSAQTRLQAKALTKKLNLKEETYRKILSKLRKAIGLIENNLREKDYSFDYSKQPSKAMLKYRKAFMRNDLERYSHFLDDVRNGKKQIHTGTLYPYELVSKVLKYRTFSFARFFEGEQMSTDERKSLDTMWNSLQDYTNGEDYLAVVDGSGSMYSGGNPLPAEVALSLGLYFAERNKGMFKGHFITFSEHPKFVKVTGSDFYEKIMNAIKYNECANTNIEATFILLLKAAVQNHVPQSQMPKALYIISDMEFDSCARNSDISNFQNAKRMFEDYGYELPKIIFWNVNSRNNQQPVTINDRGVALVSGCTPKIFEMALSDNLDPMGFMMSVINSKRYEPIKG